MSGTDGIIRIFAGTASKGFAQKMCDYLGTQMGDCSTIIFSEGNTFVRINESIRDKDVYFVQTLGLDPNNEFAELLFFLDAFKRASANSVTAIIPYFSYAKGDKKDEPRVSFHDPLAAVCIFNDDVCSYKRGYMDCVLDSRLLGGMTIFREDPAGPHQVAWDVDGDKFFEHLFEVFA